MISGDKNKTAHEDRTQPPQVLKNTIVSKNPIVIMQEISCVLVCVTSRQKLMKLQPHWQTHTHTHTSHELLHTVTHHKHLPLIINNQLYNNTPNANTMTASTVQASTAVNTFKYIATGRKEGIHVLEVDSRMSQLHSLNLIFIVCQSDIHP